MSGNKNDAVILKLQKQIREKKDALKATEKFSPVTNCSLQLDGNRYNVHAIDKEDIVPLLVKLNAYRLSAQDLGVLSEYTVSGFSVTEWIKDLKARLMISNRKVEEARLKKMEDKLHDLLSTDVKVEMEIGDIAKSLGLNVE